MTTAESGVDPKLNPGLSRHERHIWELVSLSPAKSLWDLREVPTWEIAKRTWKAILEDNLFSRAAELGFYFLFALFPTLFCASAILGLAARSAAKIYDHLLAYMALVIPNSALGMVVHTFNQTASSASSGKITFGLVGAIWSASVGISAVQETLNAVYKITDRRSYVKARIQAIALTMLLIVTVSLSLGSLFGGDFVVSWVHLRLHGRFMSDATAILLRICGWVLAAGFLGLSLALTYYWAPDLRKRRWHWITPGAALGIVGWLLASLAFRVYLNFFDTYSVTYGSLGAVIILLMWFYITGLMLLVGGEFNSELEAAAMEARLDREKAQGKSEDGAFNSIAPAA